MPSTRRAFLSAVGALTLAGCSGSPTVTDTLTPAPTVTHSPSPTPDGQDRPTQTDREPKPLDVAGAWPQHGGGPGHRGVTTAPGVPSNGAAYWRLRRIRSGPPALADGRLFHFARLGADPTGPATLTPTREPGEGPARIPEGDKYLVCRDASVGAVRWAHPLNWRGRLPVVTAGRVVAAGEGTVVAFRASDGRELWRHDLGARVAQASTAIDGTVLVSSEFVREGSRKPDVRAYAAHDGTRRWRRRSPKWQARLAATGETVLSLSSKFEHGSVLTARALADGSERWSVDIDGNGLPGGPVATSDTVYVAPDGQGVYAYDIANGSERWHAKAATSSVVTLAASEAAAYLVDDGRLTVRDAADGSERWSVAPAGERGYGGTPAVGRDTIYLEKRGIPADFVALARDDGRVRWTHSLPQTTVEGDIVTAGLAAQPTVADGAVYAYAEDGLYAFGPDE